MSKSGGFNKPLPPPVIGVAVPPAGTPGSGSTPSGDIEPRRPTARSRSTMLGGSIARSDNEADLLGYTAPGRQRAARRMLGE